MSRDGTGAVAASPDSWYDVIVTVKAWGGCVVMDEVPLTQIYCTAGAVFSDALFGLVFLRAGRWCGTSQCVLTMCLFNNGQPAKPEQGYPSSVHCSRRVEAAE